MQKLNGLEPKSVFSYFEKICSIPHGSGNTKAISDYLVSFAKDHQLTYMQDELQNVILFADGTCGMESHAPIILQGHMDMVCEKDADCKIDMEKECIDVTHDDKVVFAKGTTLGGDDGIAVAFILAILADQTIPHPPIEAVITVDEETGMEGAAGIDLSILKGKMLINIDSEDEGVFTVSCAGGAKSTIHLPIRREKTNGILYRFLVHGCIGGHSGVEIHKGRANANKVMATLLKQVEQISNIAFVSLSGGAKDNAIPRSCTVACLLKEEKDTELEIVAKDLQAEIRKNYNDPDIEIMVQNLGVHEKDAVCKTDTQKIVALLETVPNGIRTWSKDIEGLVQTSLNLGVANLDNAELRLTFAVRSSVNQEKDELLNTLKQIAKDFDGTYTERGAYPAWEYQKDSHLRDTCVQIYQKLYGKKPKIEAIHAGLECGLFSEKIPNLDCISLGPQLHDVHTSRETLEIDSAKRTYHLLLEILKAL